MPFNSLKIIPIITLILFIPINVFADNDVDMDYFLDDFNRADSAIIGNGWLEFGDPSLGMYAEIKNNALQIRDNSTNNIPCVEVPLNITDQLGNLYIDYDFDFASLGIYHDTNFIIHMRIGEDMTCATVGAGKVLTLSHSNHDKFFKNDKPENDPPNEQNYGYLDGAKWPIGKINGTVHISIDADLENKLIDVRTTGPGLIFGNGTKLDMLYNDNTKIINSMYFMSNGVADYMPPIIIDNLEVQRIEYHTCGIEVGTLDFGNLKAGDTSSQQSLTITATGNYGSDITFMSTNWQNGLGEDIFSGSNTHYSETDGLSWAGKDRVNMGSEPDDNILGTVLKDDILETFWQVKANIFNSSHYGPLYQEMTFYSLCT